MSYQTLENKINLLIDKVRTTESKLFDTQKALAEKTTDLANTQETLATYQSITDRTAGADTGGVFVITPDLKIGSYTFHGCDNITKIIIQKSVSSINCLASMTNLVEADFEGSSLTMGTYCFREDKALKTVNFNADNINAYNLAFYSCSQLENLTFAGTFTLTNTNVSFAQSPLLTVESLVALLEACVLPSGVTNRNLTIGATNLAKLTDEQIQIATAKGITLL